MKTTNPTNTDGFTRIDLAAIIVIIGALTIIAAPKLSASSAAAAGVTCTGNMHQMIRALHLYATDNADFLPPNNPSGLTSVGLNWLIHDATSIPDATNSAKFNTSFNMLAPYLNGNASVFRCPADSSTVTLSATRRAPRVRSISMSQAVGTSSQSPGCKTAVDGIWLDGFASHTANRTYRCYARLSDVVNPRPANLYAFIDEHPDSIHDAAFGCMGPRPTPTGYRWIDWVATYHNKGGGFGFMDGHGEIHIWANVGTLANPPSDGTSQLDQHWLATHTSALVTDQP
jgi:hypothetical protein